MQGINLKIYPDEMERLGLRSLEFRDGSGYVGGLSVYHELHCIVGCVPFILIFPTLLHDLKRGSRLPSSLLT